MTVETRERPDPDTLLNKLRSEEPSQLGRLKIFFGYAAGVGKTFAMLDDAQEQLRLGTDVVVGYVEPHTRPETLQLLSGLPTLLPKNVMHKNINLKEFDLDAALQLKPELILVDELAHSNAVGTRNKKRYQDIEELLQAGIDVYTTVNVQHIESLNDLVQDITKVYVRETIPDYIFDHADKVKLIDIEPDELLNRFMAGKIYRPERAAKAMQHFFKAENLKILREIAMRKAADRISHDYQHGPAISDKKGITKILVCISPSPSSAKCIRWAARMADAFHSPWIALYVNNLETHQNENSTIRKNMELAERLGAEMVTLNGYDVASVVSEYAKLSGITNIVIGKSRNKKTIKSLFELSYEEKLISKLTNIEIHIIPDQTSPLKTYKVKKIIGLRDHFMFSWHDSFKTLALLMAATILSVGLYALAISEQNVIMLYILSVLIISRVTSGYAYGIISSILSVLLFNFLFTEPYYTFNAIQPGYPITFMIMLIVALITSALTARIKTQARLSVERERRTEVLYEINRKLLKTHDLDHIIDITNEYITAHLNRSAIFYTKDSFNIVSHKHQYVTDNESSFMESVDEQAVAHWVIANRKRAGAGTDTLMGASLFYMPVMSQSNVLGVLGISCHGGKVLSQNDISFLKMIASQVAMALERQFLADEQQRIRIESEKERMRSNLLRAISHDLRTPLTSILGASSAILENGNSLDKLTHESLLSNIKEDSQWLIRMVENLLSVTRINEGTMNVTKTPEAVEEIVAEAIARIRTRFSNRKIVVTVPDQLLLVPMDGTLIEQVIINLVENAIKHSDEETSIHVIVKKRQHIAIFEVSDYGEGISEQNLPFLFEGYAPNSSSYGMGIGLSICMSIIKAHNGKMEAANKKGGGAVFRFILPLKGCEIDEP